MEKYKILVEYKDKIINASDFNDSLSILDIALSLTNNNIEIALLHSLINKNRYNIKMELDKLIIYSDVLELVYYYNDAEKILQDIENNTDDVAQINTLRRIIKNKPVRQIFEKDNAIILNKLCPHCKKKNYGSVNSPYIICGYNAKGFDWKGCGRDWCFKCGKKLCKSWNIDMLFNKLNRRHDAKCCKSYASKLEFKYPDDFCICNNDVVNRTK